MSPNDTARDEAQAEFLADIRETIHQMRADNYTRDAARAAVWETMEREVEDYISEELAHAAPDRIGDFRKGIKQLMHEVLEEAFVHV